MLEQLRRLPGLARALVLLTVALGAAASAGAAPGAAEPEQALPAGGKATGNAVIYLLRHAEKAPPPHTDDPADPGLSTSGRERAAALARLLGAEEITSVYSSDYRRTRETAQPLADALGRPAELYDPRRLDEFAATLKGLSGRHVVVGHSNTTPHLVRLLGGEPGPPIDDKAEFDRLYVVVLDNSGSPTTVLLRYGKP